MNLPILNAHLSRRVLMICYAIRYLIVRGKISAHSP